MEKHRVAVVVFAEVDGAFERDAGRVLEVMVSQLLTEHAEHRTDPKGLFLAVDKGDTHWEAEVHGVVSLESVLGNESYVRVVPADRMFRRWEE